MGSWEENEIEEVAVLPLNLTPESLPGLLTKIKCKSHIRSNVAQRILVSERPGTEHWDLDLPTSVSIRAVYRNLST